MENVGSNMSINVYDDFFSEEDYIFIWSYCMNAPYFYGEGDETEPFVPEDCTGLVHEVYDINGDCKLLENHLLFDAESVKTINQKKLFDLFSTSIEKQFPEYETKDMTRLYINCFASSENSHFHTDGKVGTTFLYYPNNNWNLDEGGETQFIVDNNIFGIPPATNRLVSFDANILHKATTFRNRHRFTIAIKYGIDN